MNKLQVFERFFCGKSKAKHYGNKTTFLQGFWDQSKETDYF